MLYQTTFSKRLGLDLEDLADRLGTSNSGLFIAAVRLAAAGKLDLGATLNARPSQADTEGVHDPLRTGFYLAEADEDIPDVVQELVDAYRLPRADIGRLVMEAYITLRNNQDGGQM